VGCNGEPWLRDRYPLALADCRVVGASAMRALGAANYN
jgi:hypothetical protein